MKGFARCLMRVLAGGIVALASSCAPAPPPEEPFTIVISIDGLKPIHTAPGQNRMPELRRLAQAGVWATGMVGVIPTNTYPSHTTLITGALPAEHGIFDNHVLDIDDTAGGSWYWYARDIKVPTLLSAARARKLTTAAVNWPVTVDADVDYLVPEYGGIHDHPIWANLIRALTFPRHLLDTYEAQGHAVRWPMNDTDYMSMATWIFRTYKPRLLLVHLLDVDDAEHLHGPDAPETLAAVDTADTLVKQMVDTVATAGLQERTNIVVLSDHGFLTSRVELRPNVAFKRAGLIEEDDYGKIRRWDAYLQSLGGSGFVMLSRPDDATLREKVSAILRDLAANPANGVETVWSPADLRAMGADPRAVFGIDMKAGFQTSGSWYEPLVRQRGDIGMHGYAPTREAMHASLVMAGPDVKKNGDLGLVRMTQIAPTIAGWIGATLPAAKDEPLSLKP